MGQLTEVACKYLRIFLVHKQIIYLMSTLTAEKGRLKEGVNSLEMSRCELPNRELEDKSGEMEARDKMCFGAKYGA